MTTNFHFDSMTFTWALKNETMADSNDSNFMRILFGTLIDMSQRKYKCKFEFYIHASMIVNTRIWSNKQFTFERTQQFIIIIFVCLNTQNLLKSDWFCFIHEIIRSTKNEKNTLNKYLHKKYSIVCVFIVLNKVKQASVFNVYLSIISIPINSKSWINV